MKSTPDLGHHFLQGIHFLWGLNGLDAEKELCQIVDETPREGVVVLASSVFEIAVTFVVEHFVCCQVHGRVQQLQVEENITNQFGNELFGKCKISKSFENSKIIMSFN